MLNVVAWTRIEPWRVARARTDRDETVIVKWLDADVDLAALAPYTPRRP
ncbi:hypothetical protein [Nonomuraea sp. NPDC050786]